MHALHVEATERLIIAAKRSARQSGMPVHWVQLSSVGAYGPVLEKANSERIVTEETASAPVGVYECTKTLADELVMSSVENGVFSYSILRPSNVYGSGMPNGSLRQWARLIKAHCFFYVGPRDQFLPMCMLTMLSRHSCSAHLRKERRIRYSIFPMIAHRRV